MLKDDFLNMFAQCLENKDIWVEENYWRGSQLCVKKPNGEIIKQPFESI